MTNYLNPVSTHSSADPFVLKHLGEYWCYSTGRSLDGRYFPIQHSSDLVHWRPMGGAMDRLPEGTLEIPDTCYWAPEVFYDNGCFYLYYSAGNETQMQIRCAVSESPAGPFMDSGRRLTGEAFAIDPHVFEDDDGQRYLFYAADFLNHPRVGTGTVMDRMRDHFTLAGEPKPVSLAKYDWQIYDPCRPEKGGACWHTLEGPFVLKHAGRYYQMFSGGNWQNSSYGVAYAVTERLDSNAEWQQPCDGQGFPLVLRSIPEEGVIGPGHNSVVRGPNNLEQFCVYHRWDPAAQTRVMAVDRLTWAGERLVVQGPTFTPQPVPRRADVEGFTGLQIGSGQWRHQPDRAAALGGPARASLSLPQGPFLLEISLRGTGEYGAAWEGPGGEIIITFRPAAGELVVRSGGQEEKFRLPEGFSGQAFHLLRLESGSDEANLRVDSPRVLWRSPLKAAGGRLQLFASDEAAFASLEVTRLR